MAKIEIKDYEHLQEILKGDASIDEAGTKYNREEHGLQILKDCDLSKIRDAELVELLNTRNDNEPVDLTGADLRDRDLHGCNFSNMILDGVNFTGANLAKTDFTYSSALNAIFDNANLEGAVFAGTMFSAETFSNADAVQSRKGDVATAQNQAVDDAGNLTNVFFQRFINAPIEFYGVKFASFEEAFTHYANALALENDAQKTSLMHELTAAVLSQYPSLLRALEHALGVPPEIFPAMLRDVIIAHKQGNLPFIKEDAKQGKKINMFSEAFLRTLNTNDKNCHNYAKNYDAAMRGETPSVQLGATVTPKKVVNTAENTTGENPDAADTPEAAKSVDLTFTVDNCSPHVKEYGYRFYSDPDDNHTVVEVDKNKTHNVHFYQDGRARCEKPIKTSIQLMAERFREKGGEGAYIEITSGSKEHKAALAQACRDCGLRTNLDPKALRHKGPPNALNIQPKGAEETPAEAKDEQSSLSPRLS